MSRFTGVYAAILTPRHNNGELNIASFRHQIEALNPKGLRGYALNGATGEFTISSESELEHLLIEVRTVAPQAEILCGIGAADMQGAVRRGRLASAAGAQAVLLPMPCFFPYRQDDLRSFVLSVASAIEIPILLYNLPQFTSGLEVETVLHLLTEQPNIVGIKDSSGSLDIIRAITQAKLPAARLIGNDGALCQAKTHGLCDGVVSGVACTLPELLISIFNSVSENTPSSRQCALLKEFIDQLAPLPTPWGLKVTSAIRGYTQESFPFPLSPERESETARLREWFRNWYQQTFPSEGEA
jgi:4-hydroxy-tetrahydrodipicolinate synthase